MDRSTWRIAWRNLGRNPKRTLLAGGAIALGQFALILVNSLMGGFYQDMLQTVTGPMLGHVQIRHPDWREERAVDLCVDNLAAVREAIAALPAVDSVSPRLYAAVLAASGEKTAAPADAEPGMVVGVDPGVEGSRGGLLEHVLPADRPGPREVAVGRILANRLGIAPGQLLAVIGQDADGFPASDLFTVRAVTDSNVDLVRSMGIVMSLADAGEFLALPDQAHELVVRGHDFGAAKDLAATLAAMPELAGAEVLSWQEAAPQIVRLIAVKGWFDLVFLTIVFVAAAAGIANTSMMSAFERTHEFGMLLAVGARPRRLVRMVLIESVLLGLAGVAVGSALGALAVAITGQTGLNYAALGGHDAEAIAFKGISISFVVYPRLELRYVVHGVLAVTLTSLLASLWPASLAARLEPMEAMRS